VRRLRHKLRTIGAQIRHRTVPHPSERAPIPDPEDPFNVVKDQLPTKNAGSCGANIAQCATDCKLLYACNSMCNNAESLGEGHAWPAGSLAPGLLDLSDADG